MSVSSIRANVGTGLGQINQTQQGGVGQPALPSLKEQLASQFRPSVQPKLLDPAQYPDIAAILRQLQRYKKKLAMMIGEPDEAFELVLASDTIAAIDGDQRIYLGAGFLMSFAHEPEVLVGALAHEIGHQPRRWRSAQFQIQRRLTPSELQAMCLQEEIRADMFAGRALAELGMEVGPLARFLQAVQIHPHPEYLPAIERAAILEEASKGQLKVSGVRRKLFPQFDRWTSVKGYLGHL